MDGEVLKPSKWSQIMSKIAKITSDPSNSSGEFQPHVIAVAVYLADLHKKYPLDKPPSSDRFPNEHYISYISELIDKRDFQTAAIFPQLELFGFDGVVRNNISIWTKYIGYVIRRYGKKRYYIWKPFIRKLIVLIEENIIGLRSCLAEPIVFTTFFKLGLDSLEKWKYEAKSTYEPKSWLDLIITSGTLETYNQLELIRFLRKKDEKYIPIDSYAVELVIRYRKYRIFKEWMKLVDMSTLQFEKGANILHIILTRVNEQQFTPFIDRFKDKLLQSDNTGMTPAELILRKPSLLRIPKIAELFSTIGDIDNADVHYLKLKKQFALYYYSKVVGPAWKFKFAVEAFFDPEDTANALNFKNTWFKNVTRSDDLIAKDFPLLELPRDILYTIIGHISLSTALALTMASKRAHQYLRSDPAFSRRIIQTTRPLIFKQEITKEDTKWNCLLKDHFCLERRWNNSEPKSNKIVPTNYRDSINIEAMDDNYIAYSVHRRRLLALWSFATQQNVRWYNSNINTLTKAEPRLFYSSLFGQEPALITLEQHNLAIYRNGEKKLQNTGTTLGYLSAIGIDDKSVYIENSNILWDIEAAKISSTLNVIDKLSYVRSVTIPAVYNNSSKLLVTASPYNEKLFFVDLRTGKSIWTMDALPTSMGFMDDHLMAITTRSSILKLDLRNFQHHKILSDNLAEVTPVMDAPNGRLILSTNSMRGYMCWDLRDENWRKVTFGSRLMKINSHSAAGANKSNLVVESFK